VTTWSKSGAVGVQRYLLSVGTAAALAGCGGMAPTPASADLGRGATPKPAAADAATTHSAAHAVAAFERQQHERAVELLNRRRLAESMVAWEVLVLLRPDVAHYRERLADVHRQVDGSVAERMPRAAAAARRGETETAMQQYLAVLALQPQNTAAADGLRALERDRNSRSYLGRHSRITLTRQAIGDAEMRAPAATDAVASSNDVEHAALLAGDGEIDAAIGLLERRMAAERRDTAARRLLANLWFRKGEALATVDRPAALDAVAQSLRIEPGEARAVALLRQLKARAANGAEGPARAGSAPARSMAVPAPAVTPAGNAARYRP
jgi:tetratricopeptide (TPR) repeat protein